MNQSAQTNYIVVYPLFQLVHNNVLPAIISAAMHENRLHRIQVMQQAAYMFINEPPLIPPRTMQRFWRLVDLHPMRVLKEFSDGKNCVQ